MTTFVLVHGAWHSGWSWARVRALLEQEGHTVLTPTLTGLGERAHLLTPEVGIQTHIDDVCAMLHYERVRDCVLVGHSYAGIVIAGVLDRLQRRPIAGLGVVRQAIYLDALMLNNGQCWADTHTSEQREARMASCQVTNGTLTLPPPRAELLGVHDDASVQWLEGLMTPHPARTYLDILVAPSIYQDGVPRVYVDCTVSSLATLAHSKAFVRHHADWEVHTLASGHDCMVAQPRMTTDLLLRFA